MGILSAAVGMGIAFLSVWLCVSLCLSASACLCSYLSPMLPILPCSPFSHFSKDGNSFSCRRHGNCIPVWLVSSLHISLAA